MWPTAKGTIRSGPRAGLTATTPGIKEPVLFWVFRDPRANEVMQRVTVTVTGSAGLTESLLLVLL